MAGTEGVEPSSSGLTGRRFTELNYAPYMALRY
jgi:hypothetical protein